MKIARVETHHLRNVPTPRPLQFAWDPGEVTTSTSFTVVKVFSDSGLVGFGHSYAPDAVAAAGARLIGSDIFATEQHSRVIRKFHRAWGLETAIWDLIGKACGQPLYKLWGGYTDRIRGYASTIEVGSPEERAEDTLGFIEEGSGRSSCVCITTRLRKTLPWRRRSPTPRTDAWTSWPTATRRRRRSRHHRSRA